MSASLLDRQKKSFDSLVDSGVYSAEFEHAEVAKAFVEGVVQRILPSLGGSRPVSVLDCGCGTGAWLSFVGSIMDKAGYRPRLCGFDLSDRMIDVAQDRLSDQAASEDVRTGNILDRRCFSFSGMEAGFDLVFTYDVVQQLPRRRQAEACRLIVEALAPGGFALIFDNDGETPFGRRMARRKFFTRYFGLPLVPRYYCNAAYPKLERIRTALAARPDLAASIIIRDDGVKRALVVRREAGIRTVTVDPRGREA